MFEHSTKTGYCHPSGGLALWSRTLERLATNPDQSLSGLFK